MTLITDYTFGRMTLEGKILTTDFILLPDNRILGHWIRGAGHLLTLADLAPALAADPDLIIAGTGAYGRLALAPGLEDGLGGMGIAFEAMETARAVIRVNQVWQKGDQRACACFHLTC